VSALTVIGIDPGQKGGIALLWQDESGAWKYNAWPWDDDKYVEIL